MVVAVLMKVVPDHEEIRPEGPRHLAAREGLPLFLNPFDQRALSAALAFRSAGEPIVALSMGPPSAASVLSGSLAVGADRALLCTDPAFRGSDTIVTSRVLAAALGPIRPSIVLAGDRAVDGETGLVPAMVAERLGIPFAGPARAIRRPDGPGRIEVTCDTDAGWARWTVPAPSVVAVGEKIAKVIHPTDEARAAAAARRVERLDRAGLALPEAEVGVPGSPTRVASVRPYRPERAGTVVSDGPIEARVRDAIGRLGDLPPSRAASGQRPVPGPRPAGTVGGSLVLATGPDGRVDARALPLLSEAARLPGAGPVAVLVGPAPQRDEIEAMQRAGAARAEVVPVPGGTVPACTASAAIASVVRDLDPDAGMILSSAFGREVAGRLAARLGAGITGDATAVARAPDGTLCWTKPSFGGRETAEIVAATRPSLATVRPGAFALGEVATRGELPVSERPAVAPDPRVEALDLGDEEATGYGDLDRARVVLSVGMGIGGPSGVARLAQLADRPDWALGASRKVVDAGWVPRRLQLGLTGRSVSPAVAVLVGVRGSANHLVAFSRAGRIVAVNSDRTAPVLSHADVGIVGPWEEVLPPLVDAIAARLPPP